MKRLQNTLRQTQSSVLADLLSVPVKDRELAQRGFSLNAIILGLIPIGLLAVLFGPAGDAKTGSLIAAALQLVVSAIAYRIARSDRVRLAGYLFFGAFALLIAAYSVLNDGGLASLSTPYWLCFIVGGAAMVISGRAALYFAALNLLLLLGIAGFFPENYARPDL